MPEEPIQLKELWLLLGEKDVQIYLLQKQLEHYRSEAERWHNAYKATGFNSDSGK